MITRANKRVMIFIDGSNVYHEQERFRPGFRVDYARLVEKLADGRDFIRAYYYASSRVPPIESQTAFYEKLSYMGFKTTIKPLRNNREKGIDVALVTDLLALGFRAGYDDSIVVSGDQDMCAAIEVVQQLGRSVEVAFFRQSFARALRQQADRVLFLDDIASDIERV